MVSIYDQDLPQTDANYRVLSPLDFIEGDVITVAVPNREQLAEQTKKVLENNRLVAKYIEKLLKAGER